MCVAHPLPLRSRPEWLLVSVLPVPPLHVRPSIFAGGNTSEDDLTHQLCNVIKANIALKSAHTNGEPAIVVEQLITALQVRPASEAAKERGGRCMQCPAGEERLALTAPRAAQTRMSLPPPSPSNTRFARAAQRVRVHGQ